METHPDNLLIQQVQTVVAEAIQVPIESISPDLAFGDLPEWDSLGHMEVMMLLEERFGIEINADTIAQLISIPEICAHLEANGHAQ
ncbi:MAG TPA: acyl carrier protein [Anaerolineales bacterium]|nr:acyl carrier protein [Anaerolineales bacterium]